MPKISAVGHFCLDKLENNQTRMCTTFFRTSKLTEPHFKYKGSFGISNCNLRCCYFTVVPNRETFYVTIGSPMFVRDVYGLCWIRCVHDCLLEAYTASWSTMRQLSLKKDPYNLPQNTSSFGNGLKQNHVAIKKQPYYITVGEIQIMQIYVIMPVLRNLEYLLLIQIYLQKMLKYSKQKIFF